MPKVLELLPTLIPGASHQDQLLTGQAGDAIGFGPIAPAVRLFDGGLQLLQFSATKTLYFHPSYAGYSCCCCARPRKLACYCNRWTMVMVNRMMHMRCRISGTRNCVDLVIHQRLHSQHAAVFCRIMRA
jgi:hypothetical protein